MMIEQHARELTALKQLFTDLLEEYPELEIEAPSEPSQFIEWFTRSGDRLFHQTMRKECLSWLDGVVCWQEDEDQAFFVCSHDSGARGWIAAHLTAEAFQRMRSLLGSKPTKQACDHAQISVCETIVRKLSDLIIEED